MRARFCCCFAAAFFRIICTCFEALSWFEALFVTDPVRADALGKGAVFGLIKEFVAIDEVFCLADMLLPGVLNHGTDERDKCLVELLLLETFIEDLTLSFVELVAPKASAHASEP